MYSGGDQNFFEPFFQHDDLILLDETRRPIPDGHKQLTVLTFVVFKPNKLHEYLVAVREARKKIPNIQSAVLKGSTIFKNDSTTKRYGPIATEILKSVESRIEKIILLSYTQKHLTMLNSEVSTNLHVEDDDQIKLIYGDELSILLNSLRDICCDLNLGKSVGVLIDNSRRFGTAKEEFNLKDGQFNTLVGLDGKLEGQKIDMTFVNDKSDFFNELVLIPDSLGYMGFIKGNNIHMEENAKSTYPAFKFPLDLETIRKNMKSAQKDGDS